jgi:hypothetical protein
MEAISESTELGEGYKVKDFKKTELNADLTSGKELTFNNNCEIKVYQEILSSFNKKNVKDRSRAFFPSECCHVAIISYGVQTVMSA